MLVTSIFSISYNVFKSFFSRGVKSQDCVVKSLEKTGLPDKFYKDDCNQ